MIEIIPAIDLIDGKCVRLTHGDFQRKTVYSDDPLEVAKRFEGLGLSRVHMVDLDGARSGRPQNLSVLERVASSTDLVIDFGGGVTATEDLDAIFGAGAAIVNIGSVALKEPDRFFGWISTHGNERILLGADARNGKVAINGWQTDTEIPIVELLLDRVSKGVARAFVTDIGSDGAMAGPSIGLYTEIRRAIPNLDLIASGGVSSIGDVASLEAIGCSGVIVGKALYEGRISDEELSGYAR
jgi:phosphoribosylformimino-5-aminoimidazole carboxamide ribotide isomerase